MFQHRPPTAPPTPDNSDTWGPGPHHYSQARGSSGPNLIPPYLYDRYRGYPPPPGEGRFQPQPQPQPPPTQTTPQPPNQPALLLNNLAQHLNNPPAPSSQPQFPGQVQQGVGGKLLLLPNGAPPPTGSEEEKIYILITELLDPETRETALLELSKKREMYEDLALVLWGGFGESSFAPGEEGES